MTNTPYEKLLARKRTWTPVRPTAGSLREGSEETIFRALALRQLELPVGEFIREATDKDVPSASLSLLKSNIIDEEKHDLALSFVADAHGVNPEAEAEAARLTQAWVEHPDHTVLKAMVLERSIFFVLLPFFRFNGDAGLRTVSADISRDEQVHVAANSLVCQELGLTISPSLDLLRKATIQWVVQGLSSRNEDRYLNRKFWLDQSDSLMYSGKAEGLFETKRARMPAFFEHNNTNLPQYA
jgi:hypothetical protein